MNYSKAQCCLCLFSHSFNYSQILFINIYFLFLVCLRFLMKEDTSSLISNAKTDDVVVAQPSDSNNGSYAKTGSNKRKKLGSGASSARFKGVVPQQNGHWGAQIYANHQRIWLGTFNSEKEAAMAYDSAAIKLRSGDSHRNFPWSNLTIQESSFQDRFSTEGVLNMIKDGSYPSKFSEFIRTQSVRREEKKGGEDCNTERVIGEGKFVCKQLFQKELTPSDVGKLNRLVIPKRYAVNYFPHMSKNEKDEQNENGIGTGGVNDVLLIFYDKSMKLWKFRYCYWRSSQSFVFTRGWNRFVKEKKLKAKDVVTFYSCESTETTIESQPICLIDVSYSSGESNGEMFEGLGKYEEILVKDLGQSIGEGGLDRDETGIFVEMPLTRMGLEQSSKKRKRIRLFGVEISSE